MHTTFSSIATWFLGVYVVIATAVVVSFYVDTWKIDGRMKNEVCGPDLPMSAIDEETAADVMLLWAYEKICKPVRGFYKATHSLFNPFKWRNQRTQSLATISPISASLESPGITGNPRHWTTVVWDITLFAVLRLTNLEAYIPGIHSQHAEDVIIEGKADIMIVRPPALIASPHLETVWPSEGAVEVSRLIVRYAPSLPNALDGLSLSISAGEKVAIVGKTGSGRNTLALSLLRFVEPAAGRILVDGRDIAKLSLAEVRGKLLLVPENPSIVGGTVRLMLDEFGQFSDAEIFGAIRRVHLNIHSTALRNLDDIAAEGSTELSIGERQLLCLARAILKQSKLIVIDESTKTTEHTMIIKTVRQELASSTVLSIVRRVRNAVDYDRIMVLEAGRLVEFDTPAALLANPVSKFAEMCRSAGEDVAQLTVLVRGVGGTGGGR